jgi:hypothetical protein
MPGVCSPSASQSLRSLSTFALIALRCLTLYVRAVSFSALDTAEYVAAQQAAQHVVDVRWSAANFSSLPCARARVHGHVKKAANNSQNPTLNIESASARPLVVQGLPVYSGCRVCTSL